MSDAVTPAEGLAKWLLVLSAILGSSVFEFGWTIAGVALPHMQGEFSATTDQIAWVMTAFVMGSSVAIACIGWLSDRFGRKRMFAFSIAGFTVTLVMCATSTTLFEESFWRFMQGALGAGIIPLGQAITVDAFPTNKQGQATALWGNGVVLGGIMGPVIGGIVVEHLSWQWIFWINIPLGAAIIALTLLLLKPSPRVSARVDFIGGALLTISLATLTLGLARVDSPDLLMAIYLAATAFAFILFIVRQKTVREPLLPKTMFRTWAFRAANLTHFLVGGALIIGMVTIPLMANTVLGLAPIDGGLMLVRLTAAIPVGAVLGGVACSRLDYRVPTIAGLALMALGFWFMSGWDASVADPAMTVHLATAGLGFGLVIAPLALAATNSVRVGDRGSAAAMITATRVMGMTVGLAALTAWGTGRFDSLVAGISLPFALPGETPEQVAQRIQEFNDRLVNAGLSVFNDFFLVAMVLSIIAIGVTAFMAWNSKKSPV